MLWTSITSWHVLLKSSSLRLMVKISCFTYLQFCYQDQSYHTHSVQGTLPQVTKTIYMYLQIPTVECDPDIKQGNKTKLINDQFLLIYWLYFTYSNYCFKLAVILFINSYANLYNNKPISSSNWLGIKKWYVQQLDRWHNASKRRVPVHEKSLYV